MTHPEQDEAVLRAARDHRRTAFVDAGVALIVLAAALLGSTALARTPFWVEHFPHAGPSGAILAVAPLFLLAAMAPAFRPLSWETELLSRGLRALAWSVLTYHAFAVLLGAPRLAAILIVPLLAALPAATFRCARLAAPLGARARAPLAVAGAVSAAAATLLVALAWWSPGITLLAVIAAPAAFVYATLPAAAGARTRRRHALAHVRGDDAPPHPLDLPPGTLHPPRGVFPLIVTLTALALVLFVVAPGVPLTAPVAWVALVLSLPLIVRAALRRSGVAHPRALAGPPGLRRHEARLELLSDAELEEIDEAIARFLRWGTGRQELAERLSRLLAAADPKATPAALSRRLASLPRRPWARAARAAGLVRLMRDGALLGAGDKA